MDINDLTVRQVKELSTMFTASGGRCPAEGLDGFAVGETVIVRTYSAGVWCGTLREKCGKEVILIDARRMWRWWCAESISLSGVVCYGITKEKSKIAAPVDQVWLEAIEIMPIKGDAAKSIMEAPIVQAD